MKGKIIMKKLIIALSALGAAFSATAKADISVSGTANVAYISSAASTDSENLAVGTKAAFALSTTTASGMGISGSIALTQDYDGDGNVGADGGQAITFTTGGTSITVGDVGIADTVGSVGGVVNGPLDDQSGISSNVATGFGEAAGTSDDGLGVSFTTAVGTASLTIGYITNDGKDNFGVINGDSTQGGTSAEMSIPMGAYTVAVGVADHDDGSSAAGGTIAAALGGGTLTVGYSTQTLVAASHAKLSTGGDTQVVGATYSMSMDADTTIAVGYNSAKDADSDAATKMELSIERALGGGASVYLDVVNLSGDAATDGTGIAFGTAVAF
jgi:hypothetical protein